jgi:hypothetical protein
MGNVRVWAVEWDFDWGTSLFWPEGPSHWQLFPTRRECRAYIEKTMGASCRRSDLRRPPHNWRTPRAVRVTLEKIQP